MSKLNYSDVNLESVCRFCLNGDPSDLIPISSTLDIYSNRNRAIDLDHVIMTCIGISVLEDDMLPKWLCKECVNQLTIYYQFRERCLETIKHLNGILIKQESVTVSKSSTGFIKSDDCNSTSAIGYELAKALSSTDCDKELQTSTASSSEPSSHVTKQKTLDSKRRPVHFHRINHGPFKCDICGALLKSRRTLVYHMRTMHIINLIDKSEMPERRPDPTETRPPVLPGDNDTLFSFKCDICGSGVKTMDSINDHMQKFHIDGNYVKRDVSDENPLECEICRNGYPNRKSLSRHRIRVHGIFRSYKPNRPSEPKSKSKVKRWQICPICGLMRKDMKSHIATHDLERLFKCEICGSDLKTAVNLKRHLRRVHTEDRQYPCELCNVAFKAPFQLKRHNRKHTQERNYACLHCEKRFIDKATLERHLVVHFRVRNVECKFCSKRFQSTLGLQNHIGIHTLERKFKCGLCSLAFITSSAASVHRRTHRDNVDNHFHCGDCDMKFQELIMLKMHLRAVSHRFAAAEEK